MQRTIETQTLLTIYKGFLIFCPSNNWSQCNYCVLDDWAIFPWDESWSERVFSESFNKDFHDIRHGTPLIFEFPKDSQ